MTPEQEILVDLLDQVKRTAAGLAETQRLIGPFPTDAAALDALPADREIAVSAMLKRFEQLQGGLAGLFRAMLRMLGISLKGLYPLDIANHMVDLGILDDPVIWIEMVKLRNALVHEYPDAADVRFARVARAHANIPFLVDAAARAETRIAERKLLP